MKCAECDQIGQCSRSCEMGAQLESLLDEMWDPQGPGSEEDSPDTVRDSDEEVPFLLTRKSVHYTEMQPQTLRGIGV